MFNTIQDVKQLKPLFKSDNLIIMSSDNNYALYLGVCVQSIIANQNPKYNYDIVILEDNITDNNKKLISNLCAQRKNIAVRFFNMKEFAERYKKLFYVRAQFSMATYYRFFIPEIFYQYTRALYLDCDLVVCKDISPLFTMDMKQNYILATPDIQVINDCSLKQPVDGWSLSFDKYLADILKIKNTNRYFQAGMMIMDINKLKKFDMLSKCIECLKEVKHPVYVDQDILNSVFYNYVGFIDLKWNHVYHVQKTDYLAGNIPDVMYREYLKAREEGPYVLHLTGRQKPWIKPNQILAECFWQYARQTPFYEEIIYKNVLLNQPTIQMKQDIPLFLPNIKDVLNYKNNYIKYLKYKFLTKLSWGKKHDKYKQKKNIYKNKIKNARNFLKDN